MSGNPKFLSICPGEGGRADAAAGVLSDVGLNARGYGIGAVQSDLNQKADMLNYAEGATLGVIGSRFEDPFNGDRELETTLLKLADETVYTEDEYYALAVSAISIK